MTDLAVTVDSRVPGYLGRVLDGEGIPAGTCFQVAPGVLVTAWHVLDDVGAGAEGAQVLVDPLRGGASFAAAVARVDPLRDLAVLTAGTGHLTGVAGPLAAAGQVAVRERVSVTGHAVPDDQYPYRFLVAAGEWAGGTTRDDAVPLGRMTSSGVVPGMSGAPVIHDGDGTVVGVVSGRYNSVDGSLAGTVWVARAEDLAALLEGITDVVIERPLPAGPADLMLEVSGDRVRLAGAGTDVSAGHSGVRPGLEEAVHEIRRARARAGLPARTEAVAVASAELLSVGRAGRLLGESFLRGPVSRELARVLGAAEAAHQPVRLGLAVPPEWTGLPWEALPAPGGQPLALHPLVTFYRKTQAPPGRVLAGPLRIVVAIAAPDFGGGPLLDYERELRNVLAAVRSARQDAADVRVVPFATTAAIRDELGLGPAHILHISGHGSPGELILENDDGSARPVTREEFLREAIPPGRMPRVITLAACYTDAAGSEGGASFAAHLCGHGAAAVIATEASITDIYATRLLARVYGALARSREADVVAALSAARRDVQADLETSPDPRDNELAALGEWAAVTVLAATGSVPVLDLKHAARTVPPPSRPRIAGLAAREDWYFVGRRREQRRWPADLTSSSLAGIVINGIGGTGKTTLAAEIAGRVRAREPGRVLVSMAGPLTLESLLGAVISDIRRELLVQGEDGGVIQALDVAGRADLPWLDRLGILRAHVLDRVPVLLLLDNFEDNLRPDPDVGYAIGDEVLAGFLAAWAADPGRSRMLVTCRYKFILPGGAERALSFRQLGALSRAETMKLAWSLPTLDRLDEGQLDQVWRLVGGHPRSLEYLDALLSGGQGRYPDVTERLASAITSRLTGADRRQWLAARIGLDAALAETVTLAADDVLLDDLLSRLAQVPGAADLVLGVSVYREPVDQNAVLFQVGQPDSDAENTPDRQGAHLRIESILAAAAITADDSSDMANVPAPVWTQLAPHMAELSQRPTPPFQPAPSLPEQVTVCQAASLLTIGAEGGEPWFFVHRWTAAELARRALSDPGQPLVKAHRQAAAYWQWRVRLWPQVQEGAVHDLLEARHHLLQCKDIEQAVAVTEAACGQLHAQGAWDQETSLIHDTLTLLPADSARQAAWIRQLGLVAQARGNHAEASRQYQRALDISERLGDQDGTASSHNNLGILAQDRGDYGQAAHHYQRALDIFKRLGDQVSMPHIASIYHNLGALSHDRGDYDEAARQYQRSLEIEERLGHLAGMAMSYNHLGNLARDRGDYDEAARQYQRSLVISERLGDQASTAVNYHNLGNLAHDRGDYDEAARQYQCSLNIRERLGDQPAWPALTTISAPLRRIAGITMRRPASTSAPSRSPSGSVTRPAWPASITSSAFSLMIAGTTMRRPASTSAPSTSESGSATRPAWPAPTTSLACSPMIAGITTRRPASTSAPSTSKSGSATRPAWPAATTNSAGLPGPAGITMRRPASISAPSTSKSGSVTRPAWPAVTARSATSPGPAGITMRRPASTSAPW